MQLAALLWQVAHLAFTISASRHRRVEKLAQLADPPVGDLEGFSWFFLGYLVFFVILGHYFHKSNIKLTQQMQQISG